MGVLPARTARFEAFVAPAMARPALWRLVVGFGLAGLCWLAATAALLPLAGGPRGVLLLYLAGFAGLVAGVGIAARLLHGRGFASLIGPDGFRLRGFALGIAVVALVAACSAAPVLLLAPPVRQAGLATWAAWLPLVLPAILLQSAAEEIAFRGYVMQGLAARFRSPLAWWILPAALFGILHWNPVEFGGDAWLAALAAAVIGLVLGHVTAATGNLSVAMGLHFANNAFAMLVLAVPSPVAAFSLWLAGVGAGAEDATLRRGLLLLDLATTLVAYAIWLWFARRRRLHSQAPGSI
jgi:uncharacterized protein